MVSNARAAQAAFDNNQPIADAAGKKLLGRTLGERAGDVSHVCFECGGATASYLGALIVVETCPICFGSGIIADADMAAAIARSNARAHGRLD
jgi:hypothetical protein